MATTLRLLAVRTTPSFPGPFAFMISGTEIRSFILPLPPELLLRVLAGVEDAQHGDVILHGPVEDHERKAGQWQLPHESTHSHSAVRELLNVFVTGVYLIDEGISRFQTARGMPARGAIHILNGLIGDAHRTCHPRAALRARALACSGV